MKKTQGRSSPEKDLRVEYDFSVREGVVRGKHAARYKEASRVVPLKKVPARKKR